MSIKDYLFPPVPRDFPGRRALKGALRGGHVLCAGVFTGSYFLAAAPALQQRWLALAALSGIALLLLDLHESCVFLLQVRGWAVVLKLAVLALFPLFAPAAAAWVLGVLLVGSVLSSHAPGRVRYALPLGRGRFHGARTKG